MSYTCLPLEAVLNEEEDHTTDYDPSHPDLTDIPPLEDISD